MDEYNEWINSITSFCKIIRGTGSTVAILQTKTKKTPKVNRSFYDL